MSDPKVEEIRDPRKYAQGYIDSFTRLGMSAEQSELTWTLQALLTWLDEQVGENAAIIAANKALAEQLDRQQEKFGVEVEEHHGDLRLGWDFEERAVAAEERERALIDQLRALVERANTPEENTFGTGREFVGGFNDGKAAIGEAIATILSRLLPSTPTEEGNDDDRL